MRPWVLAIVATGCFSKPDAPSLTGDARIDGPGSGRIDAAVVRHCTDVPFGTTTVTFTDLQGAVAADPAIRGDLLDLFFTKGSPGVYRVWHATRATSAEAFTVDMTDLFNTASTEETDPAPTSDGKTVAYLSHDFNTTATTARLATLTPAFAPAPPMPGNWTTVAMPGLETTSVQSLDLSPDGTTLYWNDDAQDLRIATWNPATSKFTTSPTVWGHGFRFPAVSPDGLELFYNGNVGVNRAVRSSTAEAFIGDPADTAIVNGVDPDISADGQMLVFASGSSALYVTRTCPTQ